MKWDVKGNINFMEISEQQVVKIFICKVIRFYRKIKPLFHSQFGIIQAIEEGVGKWTNGQDVLESTNGHELLNINGLSNNASIPKVQGFQSTSEGSTFLVPSEAKGEFCLLLLLDISNFLLIIVFYLLLIWHLQLLFAFIQPF